MSKKEMILPLEKQVCAFEYSKKLEELGVKQESLWWWNPKYPLNTKYARDKELQEWNVSIYKYKGAISALTVAELWERLPSIIENNKISHTLYIAKFESQYEINYRNYDCRNLKSCICEHYITADTLANALAKMVIYLIENKLMEV